MKAEGRGNGRRWDPHGSENRSSWIFWADVVMVESNLNQGQIITLKYNNVACLSMTLKSGTPLLRADRAGISALCLGGISVLYIGTKFQDYDISFIAAIMALVFGAMAQGGNKELTGTIGASFGAFVLFKIYIYNRFIREHLVKNHDLLGLEFNIGLLLMLFLIIFSLLYVLALIPKAKYFKK